MTTSPNDPEPISIMIAGAQKAGTTTLAAALGGHRDVQPPLSWEFPFFVDEQRFADGYPLAHALDFPEPAAGRRLMAKSAGVCFLEQGVRRLAEHNPDCAVVVALRHPVDRAWSAYWYLRRTGREDAATFEEAIELEDRRVASDPARFHHNAYLGRGRYLEQIERLEGTFDTVVTCFFDDIVADEVAAATAVARALGLSSEPLVLPEEGVHRNRAAAARSVHLARLLRSPGRAGRKVARAMPPVLRELLKRRLIDLNERAIDIPPLDPTTRARLLEHFEPHNAALSAHLGVDLDAWNA